MFHRVDDPDQLDGPTYFRLVWRLAAYQGVMQSRVLAAREDAPAEQPFEYSGPAQRGDINPGTQVTLQSDPGFAGVFSFGTAGG